MKIDIVDKRRYPNPLRTILYDLTFKGNGGPVPIGFFLLLIFIFFIICLRMDNGESTKYYGLVLCFIGFFAPFLLAFVSYFSSLIIKDNKFKIKFLNFTYNQGKLEDIVELHHLEIYNGCYRVRVKGFSEISGFLLHWRYVPESLKHLPVIEYPSSE